MALRRVLGKDKMMNAKWDRKFMRLAIFTASENSKDETKLGAVIIDPETKSVRSSGYNGFPRGVNDDVAERHQRPLKYLFSSHAEENTILNALLNGASVRDCVIYVNAFPCCHCARAIIQSGLKRVVGFEPNFNDPRWGAEYKITLQMFEEANVSITMLCRKDYPGQELPARVLAAQDQAPDHPQK